MTRGPQMVAESKDEMVRRKGMVWRFHDSS